MTATRPTIGARVEFAWAGKHLKGEVIDIQRPHSPVTRFWVRADGDHLSAWFRENQLTLVTPVTP